MASDGTPTIPYGSGGKAWGEGGGVGPFFDLVAPNDFFYNVFTDDFRGDALRDEYPAAKTNGTSAAVTFTEHNEHGFLDFVTGTDNAGYAGQGVGLQWTGDRGVLMEFLFTTPSSLATYKLELGAADADDAAGMVNAKVTPTFTGTDLAVICFDTASGDTTTQLIHAKAGAGAAVTFADGSTNFALAVSTLYYATVRIDGDNVYATITGLTGTPSKTFMAANATAGAGIEGGTALTPWFFTQARAGAASKTTPLSKWRVIEPAW